MVVRKGSLQKRRAAGLILLPGDPAGQAEEGLQAQEGPHRASLVNNARLPGLAAAGSRIKVIPRDGLQCNRHNLGPRG